jgi:hypothetical protein
MLVKNAGGTVVIKGVADITSGAWTMMGGNFAHTSDSRFGEAIEKIVGYRMYGAVAIHDRIEGKPMRYMD